MITLEMRAHLEGAANEMMQRCGDPLFTDEQIAESWEALIDASHSAGLSDVPDLTEVSKRLHEVMSRDDVAWTVSKDWRIADLYGEGVVRVHSAVVGQYDVVVMECKQAPHKVEVASPIGASQHALVSSVDVGKSTALAVLRSVLQRDLRSLVGAP